MAQSAMQPATEKRKDTRIHVVLRVKVGSNEMLSDGQAALTYEVSSRGARISLLKGFSAEQVVWVQRHARKAKFKVIWVGEKGTAQEGQMGLESLDADSNLWDAELRPKLAQ